MLTIPHNLGKGSKIPDVFVSFYTVLTIVVINENLQHFCEN